MSDQPFPLIAVHPSNNYVAHRTIENDWVVTVNGQLLPTRNDLRNHSPDGFSWGYGGSGPAQLALAILAYEYGDQIAQSWYQDFKWRVISRFNQNAGWSLNSEGIFLTLVGLKAEREAASKPHW